MVFDEIFLRKKPIPDKLESFGFTRRGADWRYTTDMMQGTFRLTVTIDESGAVDTSLLEIETGEPYVLYKTSAVGAYVAEVRAAVEAVLAEIAEQCFAPAVFQSRQAAMVIEHVRETYGDALEFLWPKFPENAVFRRADNRKWYAAILTVVGSKLGLPTDRMVEIIDLRMNPAEKEKVLARDNYYPGWHMNKNSWYTLLLDGSIPDAELKARIDESYILAAK